MPGFSSLMCRLSGGASTAATPDAPRPSSLACPREHGHVLSEGAMGERSLPVRFSRPAGHGQRGSHPAGETHVAHGTPVKRDTGMSVGMAPGVRRQEVRPYGGPRKVS